MRPNVRTGPAVALLIVISVLLTMSLMALQGCSYMGGKSWTEMSPKERATQVMGIYNNQYDLYLREAKSENLTETKKEVLREKKKLLTELYPYLEMYASYADTDTFAPADVEMAVMKIMDKLLGL
jgi:hypothetical protein